MSLLIRKIKNVIWITHANAISYLLRKVFELLKENLKTVRAKLPVSELFLLFTGLSNDFDAAAFYLTHEHGSQEQTHGGKKRPRVVTTGNV